MKSYTHQPKAFPMVKYHRWQENVGRFPGERWKIIIEAVGFSNERAFYNFMSFHLFNVFFYSMYYKQYTSAGSVSSLFVHL